MVRGAGAKEVHLRISCPPTISPCFYGVDTPSKSELIAANQSASRKFAASLKLIRWPIFLWMVCYLCVVQAENKLGYCTACYTGNYPTQWIDVDEILPATESVQV